MASFAPADKKEGGSRPRVGPSHGWVQRAVDPVKRAFSTPLVQAAPECAACRAGGPAPCPACAGGAQMLQRQVLGNGSRGATIQAKLTVGEPNDPYEQEADRVAEQVMRMAAPSTPPIQREAEEEKPVGIQPKPMAENITPLVQRQEVNLPPVPDYQLTPPSLLTPPNQSAPYQPGGPYPFRLNRQMQVTALQFTQQQITPATLTPLLSQLSLDALALTPPVGASGTASSSPSPTTPPAPANAQEEAVRAAAPVDLLKAVMTLPAFATAISQLQSQTEQRLRSDWNRIRVGEQVGVVSSLAVVGSGAIAGIIASPDARQLVLSQLNGRVLPVPGINWLRVELNTGPDSLMMGLHLDVGALPPSILGFGPGSSSAIGGPPQPQPFVPGVQRAATSAAAPAPQPDLESRLSQSQGSGSPLPDEVRGFMEPRFGADFSQVRVHKGGDAMQMNRELNAQAFTHKQDVYFGAGKAPGKNALTAHELSHVVQQSGAEVIRADQSTGNCVLSVQKRIIEADPILHLALTIQRSTREELLTAYNEALSRSDWNEVAIRLNGFNDADIKRLIASSSFRKTTLIAVKEAALTAMPGWNARVVQPINTRLAVLMGDQVLHASAKEIQDYLLHSPFLKAYISSNFSGGNPLEGHIHIDDDDAFRTACIAYTMRQGKTREESEALEPQQSAFREGDDIHVRKNDGKFTTTIHESIHRFSSPEYQHRLSNNANEGATEYFTRIICKDQTLTFSSSYPKQLNSTDLLVSASSKEMVADAFFNGALQALLTAVDKAKGAGTLRRWSLLMNIGSYAQADALIRNAQSTQSPKPSASIQPKLTIGQPNDRYEQEGDWAADEVMSISPTATPSIQHQSEEGQEEVQAKPLVETITPIVQRQEALEDEAQVQAKCESCEGEEQVQRSPNGVPKPLLTKLLNTPRLQEAARNAPTLRQGTNSDDVKRVQFALRLLGYPLENSFPGGSPDGKYGPDTAENICQFQIDEEISPPSGFEAGKRTLHVLDDRLIKANLDPALVDPPNPNPNPTPPTPRPTHVSCTLEQSQSIVSAVSSASQILAKADRRIVGEIAQAKNASFIAFRSRDFQVVREGQQHIQQALSCLSKVEYRCASDTDHTLQFCDKATAAFARNFSPVIMLCPLFFKEPNVQARIIIHESMHTGAGLQRPGTIFDPEHYLSLDDPLKELEPGLDTDSRIRNADHNASFAITLATVTNLEPIASHRAGNNLGIGLIASKKTIPVTGLVPALKITGNDDQQVGITRILWTVTDDRSNPVKITQFDDVNEARISKPDRDRLVSSGATALLVSVNAEVTGTGSLTILGSIEIEQP